MFLDFILSHTTYGRLKRKVDKILEKIERDETCTPEDFVAAQAFCAQAPELAHKAGAGAIFLAMELSGKSGKEQKELLDKWERQSVEEMKEDARARGLNV